MSDKTFKIVNGDVSDGYHTFDELYEHRCLLFINLCLTAPTQAAWKPDYEGWFCLYFETPFGQISYHIPERYLPLVEGTIHRNATTYDGHTSHDVIQRLYKMACRG